MPIALPPAPIATGGRSIGAVVLDDMVNSYVESMTCGYPRAVQLDQIHNRYGRVTRVKEDAGLLTIDVRGWWRDGGGRFWRDFEAALMSQSRVPFTLGDGTRYEWCDVKSLVPVKIASRNAFGVVPDQAFAYTMLVDSYEPFAREVTPVWQNLGNLNTGGGNLLTANQASMEASAAGWTPLLSCTITSDASIALSGTHSLKIRSNAIGTVRVGTTPGAVVLPNTQYTAAVGIHAAFAGPARSAQLGIHWYDINGVDLGVVLGTSASDSTSAWTTLTATGNSPGTAATATLEVTVSTVLLSESHFLDEAVLSAGATAPWLAPGAAGSNSTNLSTYCIGTAFSEPLWQFSLIVPPGVTVTRVMLQNATSGETCVVTMNPPLGGAPGGGPGAYTVLMDASGGASPPAVLTPATPGNNQYGGYALPGITTTVASVGWGCTLGTGATYYDIDFLGRPPTLVPSTAPTIPPTPQPNALVATITATGTLTTANLSVIAPSRFYR